MKESRDNGGGLSLQTLVIASLASGTAALVVSQFWKGGTIMSAAVTPVVVAIVSELLHRPARQVTRFASPVREPRGLQPGRPAEPSTAGLERLGGEVRGAAPRRRLHWRLALTTGLLAFAIAAVVVTVPELISGSAAWGDRATTLFGGDDGGRTTQQQEAQPDQPTETTPPAQPEQAPESGQAPPEQTQPPQEQPPSDSAPQAEPPPETQPAPQSQPAP